MDAVVKKSVESFKQTSSFRNHTGPLFDFVKNVDPNIKSQVNDLKHQALGTKREVCKNVMAQNVSVAV